MMLFPSRRESFSRVESSCITLPETKHYKVKGKLQTCTG